MVNELVKIGTGQTQCIPKLEAEDLTKYLIKIDKADSSTEYYGWAESGTATSSAKWRIYRKSISGNVTTYAWADGNTRFDNVWDNRASLSYS